jgi:hypothetical protein
LLRQTMSARPQPSAAPFSQGGEFQQLHDETLRHWITSFQVVDDETNLKRFAESAKPR